MHADSDPFAHHPELRDKIGDPLLSHLRTFDPRTFFAARPELADKLDLLNSDAVLANSRAQTLAGLAGDIWVFAYGSLMWDPAFRFSEVRRAFAPSHARRFILKDIYGGRGDEKAPGLMAALDHGLGCTGLAFRIAAADVDAETQVLWRREMPGPGYTPTFVPVTLADERVSALAFLADHTAESMHPDITRSDQIRYIATGAGFLGTSLDYLRNIDGHFAALGIDDAEVSELLRDVTDYIRSNGRGQ